MSRSTTKNDAPRETPQISPSETPPLQPATPTAPAAPALDPNRFSLLKRPIAGQPDPQPVLRRPVPGPLSR